MRQRNTIRVAVFIVILLQGVEVQASGFLLSKFGGDLGYPTSFGAVSVFWNPAAMAYRPETSILLEHTLLYRRIDYDRKAPIVDDPSNTGVGG